MKEEKCLFIKNYNHVTTLRGKKCILDVRHPLPKTTHFIKPALETEVSPEKSAQRSLWEESLQYQSRCQSPSSNTYLIQNKQFLIISTLNFAKITQTLFLRCQVSKQTAEPF